jgi:hypothetical protein
VVSLLRQILAMEPRRRDLLIVLLGTLACFVLAVGFDLFDRIHGWTRPLETWELDEAIAALAAASVLWAWYGLRRARAESGQRLARSQEDFRLLFDNASDAILVLRPEDERILEANRRAEDLYGYSREELLGMSTLDFSLNPEQGCQQVERTLAADSFHTFTTRQQNREGKELQIEVNASTIQRHGETVILSLNRDITEQVELREGLQQAQKMEAMGRIAGGVAHDFNNLLTVIGGGVELLQTHATLQGRAGEDVRMIQEAVEKATVLTRQLLTFSRRQRAEPVKIDLGAEVASALEMLRRLLPDPVVLAVETQEGLPPVIFDPNQLQQVLINLAINSSDAMPQGGQVEITTRSVATAAGTAVRLTVRDTGSGMSPEVRAKALEPFFTTKPPGMGTGLGLPIVLRLVGNAGGELAIHSEPGAGTTVVIDLPPAAGCAEPRDCPASAAGETRGADALDRDRTLLVVSDQPSVRFLVGDTVRGAGPRVLEAHDADEALKLLRSDLEVDLLLTDVGLPGTRGPELAREARRIRPDLTVRYLSGYGGDELRGLPPGSLLRKPFNRGELLRFLASAMGPRSRT